MYTKLIRCPHMEYCNSSHSQWPTEEDVNTAVKKTTFDSNPYDAHAKRGLRNYLEGFNPVDECPEGVEKPFCETKCGKRLLHNSVSQCYVSFWTIMASMHFFIMI